ncbi:MAG: dihydrofolate reductase [Bacteriovoracaceae bacterium]|nr:dihydrofolate reductase [Bacteriovoracaceae bacterium]
MKISLIAALGNGRELGKDNKMLWHIKEDFLHFKKTTMGHTLLMGRKTFESIGRPLPGRKTYILTRDQGYQRENCQTIHSINEGIELAREAGEEELFIAGGADVYKQTINKVDTMYLSFVDYVGVADAFFPEWNSEEWSEVESHEFKATDTSLGWRLVRLERI